MHRSTSTSFAVNGMLVHGRNFMLIPITSDVAESAADLRARYNLRTPDAVQIAAALNADCEAFITNDNGLKRVSEIRVLALEELMI